MGVQFIPFTTSGSGGAWTTNGIDPVGGDGKVGDWHLNTTSLQVFEKTGVATWTYRGQLIP